MDISSEARVGTFSIGPSPAVSHVVALHILLCSSLSRLQHRLLQSLQTSLARLRRLTALLPLSLLAVLLTSLLLRRRRELCSWVDSARRRRLWLNKMRTAVTYEGWAHAAKMVGAEAAGTEEKVAEEEELYDEGLVKGTLAEFRWRRQRGSVRDMVFRMRGDLLKNLGNMCNPQLHRAGWRSHSCQLHVSILAKLIYISDLPLSI